MMAAILNALSAGAKSCVDEAASVGELVRAIRTVLTGSVWAPRRVLSMFVDQPYRSSEHSLYENRRPFTSREKEVLRMLVAGSSNKEIAAPLGIEERTVKAHAAKLLRNVGVSNGVMSCSLHMRSRILWLYPAPISKSALPTGRQTTRIIITSPALDFRRVSLRLSLSPRFKSETSLPAWVTEAQAMS
jgi:DNA-binding CsgD family transcriptional regulator